jgi:hypothetical protein
MRAMADHNQNFFSAAAKRVIALINSQPRTLCVVEIEQVLMEAWRDHAPFLGRKFRGETP